jgi:hypothetical protein
MNIQQPYMAQEKEIVALADLNIGDVILAHGLDEYTVVEFDSKGQPVGIKSYDRVTRMTFAITWPSGAQKSFARVVSPRFAKVSA